MPAKSTRPSSAEGPAFPSEGLRRGLDRLVARIALWGGGGMLLGLMGLTVVEVTLRYLFNAPLYGARDVSKLMLLIMVSLSVAYSARTGGQVVIEFFSRRMGPRLATASEAGARLAAIVMLAVLVGQLWISARQAHVFGETSLALGIPYGPFYGILALGMLLYAVVLIVEVVFILQGRIRRIGSPPEDLST